MDFLKRLFDQTRTLWAGMSMPARLGLLGAAVALAVTVWTTTITTGADPWKVVAGFDTPREDRAKIHDLLKSKTYEMDEAAYNRDGVVKVKEDREGAARLELVAAGIATDQDIFKWLEIADFSRTSSTEQKLWLRSVQKKIELMLSGFGPIERASVSIVPQSDRQTFIGSGPEATASVVVRLKQGQQDRVFGTYEARAIAKILQGAVQGLQPQNIFITEAGTGKYFAVPKEDETYWQLFTMGEAEKQKAADLKEKIGAHLRKLFGNMFALEVVCRMNPTSLNRDNEKQTLDETATPKTESRVEKDTNEGLGYIPGGDQFLKGTTQPESTQKSTHDLNEKKLGAFPSKERTTEVTPAGSRLAYLNVVATINVDPAKVSDAVKKDIEDTLKTLARSEEVGPDGKAVDVAKVHVSFIPPIIEPPPIPIDTFLSQAGDWVKQYAWSGILVLLAVAALAIVYRLIRTALERRGIKELEEATTKAEEETPEFLQWEAAEAAVARAKQQVKEMVQRNPRAVATVLKRWMAIPK